jgi:hypothetical protein
MGWSQQMRFGAFIEWITQSHVVAALASFIGLVGGFLAIVRPWLQRRRERRENRPGLAFANLQVHDPLPYTEAGKASFELLNTGGGKAVMSELLLCVIQHGPSEEPKMVEVAAPVPRFDYRVTLDPKVAQYDVRHREFGSEGPHSFAQQEVESVTVELRSKRPQWYVLQFVARWYDAKQPGAKLESRSDLVRIEFRPEVEDLLQGPPDRPQTANKHEA